jgi:hypothetical protein
MVQHTQLLSQPDIPLPLEYHQLTHAHTEQDNDNSGSFFSLTTSEHFLLILNSFTI